MFNELVLPLPGQRMLYGSMAGHEAAFLRRKLEEQQEAAELQRAIELQNRRFMGLQLLDLKSRGHHLGSPVGSPAEGNGGCFNGNGNGVHHFEDGIQGPVLESYCILICSTNAHWLFGCSKLIS